MSAAARSGSRSYGTGVLRSGRREFPADQLSVVMAIVNRTPDSFTGLRHLGPRGRAGASARGVGRRRHRRCRRALAPATRLTRRRKPTDDPAHRGRPGGVPELIISVDTWRHEVGREACAVGADLLNDTWGGWIPAGGGGRAG
jgi:dihydropteroate synthase